MAHVSLPPPPCHSHLCHARWRHRCLFPRQHSLSWSTNTPPVHQYARPVAFNNALICLPPTIIPGEPQRKKKGLRCVSSRHGADCSAPSIALFRFCSMALPCSTIPWCPKPWSSLRVGFEIEVRLRHVCPAAIGHVLSQMPDSMYMTSAYCPPPHRHKDIPLRIHIYVVVYMVSMSKPFV